MNGARHNFFSAARLAGDQDRGGSARGAYHQIHHLAHGLAGDDGRHTEIDALFFGHGLSDPYRPKPLHY